MNLYSMPASYKFSKEELQIIREHLTKKRERYFVKYGFYKNTLKNLPIVVIIDQDNNAPRKSGVEVKWEMIAKRPISDLEFEELIENFGTQKRRFICWYYKDIEGLIDDDLKYKIETPEKFIQECLFRKYTKKAR